MIENRPARGFCVFLPPGQNCPVHPGVEASPDFAQIILLRKPQCVVDDQEVAFAKSGRGLDSLVHVPPGGCLRDVEPGTELGEHLVLPKMGQGNQGLLVAAKPSSRRAQFTPSCVDQLRDMLGQFVPPPRPG